MSMNQYEIDYQQGYDACNDKWIERLEQIRAEIENLSIYEYMTDGITCYGQRQLTAKELKGQVFEIIDKVLKENN